MRNGTSSYSFDQIGNRTTVSIPDEPNPVVYVANALNQYTSITGGTASSPSYDDDGNMTDNGDGNTHTWTGENRLEVYTQGDITVENTYDGQGRRVRKLVKDLGAVTKDLRYMYDGWNLLYEVDMHQVSEPTRRYVWGHDLSGHAGLPRLGVGAGGVGGLLFTESNSVSHAVTYDANGNISEYIDLSDGSITAHLEYDAFGKTIASTGTAPAPYGFSTKYLDQESDYYYYGFRYYDPETGRWLNRDPIEERGGKNLYGFVENKGTLKIDILGQFSSSLYSGSVHLDTQLSYFFSSLRDGLFSIFSGPPCCEYTGQSKISTTNQTEVNRFEPFEGFKAEMVWHSCSCEISCPSTTKTKLGFSGANSIFEEVPFWPNLRVPKTFIDYQVGNHYYMNLMLENADVITSPVEMPEGIPIDKISVGPALQEIANIFSESEVSAPTSKVSLYNELIKKVEEDMKLVNKEDLKILLEHYWGKDDFKQYTLLKNSVPTFTEECSNYCKKKKGEILNYRYLKNRNEAEKLFQ